MPNTQVLSKSFLRRLCDLHVPVSIFLINGIKLQGCLDDFDDHAIILKDSIQLIFKHAISTIVPLDIFEYDKADKNLAETKFN